MELALPIDFLDSVFLLFLFKELFKLFFEMV